MSPPVIPPSQPTTASGGFYGSLYRPGQALFTAPERVGDCIDKLTKKENPNILQRVLVNAPAKAFKWFATRAVDYDFKKMIPVGKFRVAQTPVGGLMMMFLPFTIGARMIQSLKRAQKPGQEPDKSEFFDILRRDIPTIGTLLFALDPLVKRLNIIKSKMDGMTIVESSEKAGEKAASGAKKVFGEVFSYSKLESIFNITKTDDPTVLYEIAKQGNARGMGAALEKITAQWQKWVANSRLAPEEIKQTQQEVTAFKTAISDMLAHLKENNTAGAIEKSKEAFGIMNKLDPDRATEKLFGGKLFDGVSERELPKISSFMMRHARTRRLPIDMLSFAVVAVGIGWLPVWFNDLWNRKKFAEKKRQAAAPAPQPPAQTAAASSPGFDSGASFRAFQQAVNPAGQFTAGA